VVYRIFRPDHQFTGTLYRSTSNIDGFSVYPCIVPWYCGSFVQKYFLEITPSVIIISMA
jgi:hypothetical protein